MESNEAAFSAARAYTASRQPKGKTIAAGCRSENPIAQAGRNVTAVAAESRMTWTDEVREHLEAWGRWAKKETDRLGYPNTSSISRMVEQAKVFERREKTGRKRLREARGDPRKVAEAYGYAEPELTARGTQPRSMRPPTIGEVDPMIMAVDRAISAAPGRFQATLYRRYLFGQPDRFAARDLGMSKAAYTDRAEAAVDYVAERLALGR